MLARSVLRRAQLAAWRPAASHACARPLRRMLATPAASAEHGGSGRGSDALWAIFSAMVFVPTFLYLTKPPEKYLEHKAANHATSASEVHHDATTAPAEIPPPDYFECVLVGGGTASYSAMLGIQEVEPDAEILIIAGENYAPYQRPPLTKELWFTDDPNIADNLTFTNWEGKPTSLFYQPESEYGAADSLVPTGRGLKLAKGRKAIALDTEKQEITLEDGTTVKYGKLLLATGGTPRTLSYQKSLPKHAQSKVTTYRGLDDFKHLLEVATPDKEVAVIGGGFLGSELAVALAKKTKVAQLFPEEGNMALVFPKYLSKWTTQQVADQGVTVLPKTTIQGMSAREDGKIELKLGSSETRAFDHVVVAVGIEPNVALAKSAGLELDARRGGIVVNAELEAVRNVFVAGDAASFHDVALGRRRVEHYDNAVLQGRWAGRGMAGMPRIFNHQSMFWSDLGPKIGYEAIGVLDSSLVTVGMWSQDDAKPSQAEGTPLDEQYKKGVVFYVRDDTIVGVLMFNLHGHVDLARKILLGKHKAAEANELAKRFSIFQK